MLNTALESGRRFERRLGCDSYMSLNLRLEGIV